MGLRQDDRLVALAPGDGLVGPHLVKPLALDPPTSLVEFKNGGGVPRCVGKIERPRVEVNANQGEQSPRLPVTRPKNIVVPMSRFPSLAEAGIGLAENRDKSGLQPLAMLMKQNPGVVDMHVFDDLAQRPSQNQPPRDKANRQDAGPNEISHDLIPGDFPDMDARVLL